MYLKKLMGAKLAILDLSKVFIQILNSSNQIDNVQI